MSGEPAERKHPRHRLDDALLTPLRLSMMAALGGEREIDFTTLRELLETGDSALSKAIGHLQKTGYIQVRKGYVANRPRTWVKATKAGTAAFDAHISALREISYGEFSAADPGSG